MKRAFTFWARNSLSRRAGLPLILIALVFAVIMVYLVFMIQMQSVRVQATKEAEAIVTQTLAIPPTTIHLISDHLNEQGLYRINFIGPWAIDPDNQPRSAWEKEAIAILLDDPQSKLTRLEGTAGESHLLYTSAAIASSVSCVSCHNHNPDSPRRDFEQGDLMGAIVVEIPLTDALATARVQAVGTSLAALALLAGFVGFVLLFQRRAVIQPVEQLAQAAQRMARGNLAVELEVKSEDEIGHMTRSFNQMARQLRNLYEALRRSEEHFRSLIENASDLITILNDDRTIRYQSPSVERVLGYEPDDLTDKSIFDFVHPDDRPSVIDVFAETIQILGATASMEFRFRHNDGSWRILEAMVNNLLDDPAVAGIVINSRDITVRVQAEAELEIYARQQAALVHLSADLAATLDEVDICRATVRGLRDTLGYDHVGLFILDEASGERVLWAKVGWPDAPLDWRIPPGQGVSERALVDGQLYYTPDVTREPSYVPGLDSGAEVDVPIRIGEETVGVLIVESKQPNAFAQDDFAVLTAAANQTSVALERAYKHQAVKEAEARYRSLFDGVPVGLYRTTPMGRFLDANPALVEMLGYPDRESLLTVGSANSYVDPDARRQWQALMEREGVVRAFEARMRRRDGTIIWARDVSRVVRDGAGRALHYEGSLEDITERKRADEVLKQYAERLRILHEIDQAILAAQSSEAIAQAALDYIRQLVPCRQASVRVLDFEAGEGTILAIQVDGETQVEVAQIPLAITSISQDLQDGQVHVVEDALALSEPLPLVQMLPAGVIRSYIVVPLTARGELIGSLYLGADSPGAFAPEHVDIAREVADILAIAIQQARLFEQSRQQANDLSLLYEIGQLFSSMLEQEAVFQEISRRCVESLDVDFALLRLIEDDWLVARGSFYRDSGEKEEVERLLGENPIRVGEAIAGRVAQTGEPVVSEFDTASLEAQTLPGYVDFLRERKWLLVPLKVKGRVSGVLTFITRDPARSFSQRDLSLAQGIANQAAITIENARLFESERHRRQEAETLREATVALTWSLDLDQVLDSILIHLEQVVPYDSACVFLLEGEWLRAVAGRGFPIPERVIGHGHSADDVLFGELQRTQRPLLLADAQACPHFKYWDGTNPVRGWIGVPLITRGEVIGYLTLDSQRVAAYSEAEAALAQAFANQAAVAIENARLFDETRRRAAHQQALNTIIAAAAAAPDLPILLETALDHTLRALGLDMGGIWVAGLSVLRNLPPEIGAVASKTGWTVESNVPDVVTIQDWQQMATGDPFSALGSQMAGLGVRASITVPVLAEEQRIGGLSVAASEPRRWSLEEVALVKTVGRQLGTTAERLRLLQEVRRQAEELAAAVARLQELDRLKSEFVQNTSHELRTPLALIRGYAEMLEMGELGTLQPDQQKPVAVIARRARMLSGLVEDITFILEAEAHAPEFKPVMLSELTRVVIQDFRATAKKAGLTLQAEIASHLPAVNGSPTHLRRALDNLISNAIKFTPAGGTISVRLWQEGDQIALEVSDTGIGIPPDQVDRVFERFYQVDGSIRRRYGGVGLGLALVREIVQAHDGLVTVKSRAGEGSTFTVVLPALVLA